MNDRTERPTNLAAALDANAIEAIEAGAGEAADALRSSARRLDAIGANTRSIGRALRDADRAVDAELPSAATRSCDDLSRASAVASQLSDRADAFASAIDDPESDRGRAYWRATCVAVESPVAWQLYGVIHAADALDEAHEALDALATYEASAIDFATIALDDPRTRSATARSAHAIGSALYALAKVGTLSTARSASELRTMLDEGTLRSSVRTRLSTAAIGFESAYSIAADLVERDRGSIAIALALDAISTGSGTQRARSTTARAALSMLRSRSAR